MRITVNGNEIQMEEAKSVESYLLASGYQMKRISSGIKRRYSSEVSVFRDHVKRW